MSYFSTIGGNTFLVYVLESTILIFKSNFRNKTTLLTIVLKNIISSLLTDICIKIGAEQGLQNIIEC